MVVIATLFMTFWPEPKVRQEIEAQKVAESEKEKVGKAWGYR